MMIYIRRLCMFYKRVSEEVAEVDRKLVAKEIVPENAPLAYKVLCFIKILVFYFILVVSAETISNRLLTLMV